MPPPFWPRPFHPTSITPSRVDNAGVLGTGGGVVSSSTSTTTGSENSPFVPWATARTLNAYVVATISGEYVAVLSSLLAISRHGSIAWLTRAYSS